MEIQEADVSSASENVDPVPYHYSAFVKYRNTTGWFGLSVHPMTSKETLLQRIYSEPTIETAKVVRIRLPR